jgi:type II secretory pathway component PulM
MMKILQRRTKRSTTMLQISALSARMTGYQNLLFIRWQALSSRDQLALLLLSAFLLLFVGGYGGYSIHQAANNSKSEYQEQVADYFWLRAQAGNIDSNVLAAANTADGTEVIPAASSVNTLLTSSGIVNAQVIAAGDTIQLSFNNPSQAVVSAALGKLEQQGWQFTQLSMQQDLLTKAIQVQATVTL